MGVGRQKQLKGLLVASKVIFINVNCEVFEMKIFSHLKNARSRVQNGLLAFLLLIAYTISAITPFIAVAPASAAIIATCTKDAQGAR